MYPILFPAKETVFTSQGLGAMSDAILCDVTEERNGAFELKMEYPANGIHFDEMREGMLIFAKPNDTADRQLFRIYSIDKAFNRRVTVSAEHISYELNNYPVVPTGSEFGGNPEALWAIFSNNQQPLIRYTPPIPCTNFTFSSPIRSTKDIKPEDVFSLRALLGGNEKSFLDLWQGEYEFDNRRVIFHENRGNDNGVTIKFGKNLTDLEQEVTIENLYTHVFPYAKKTEYPVSQDQTTGTQYADPIEKWIYAPSDTSGDWSGGVLTLKKNDVALETIYGFKKVKFLDLTGVFESDYDIKPADVKEQCENYISTNEEIVRPKITLTVSFQPLSARDADPVAAKLEKVSLCDKVRVCLPLYGIDEKLKVNKTVYDVLNERYKSIEIGDAKSNFADTIREQYSD